MSIMRRIRPGRLMVHSSEVRVFRERLMSMIGELGLWFRWRRLCRTLLETRLRDPRNGRAILKSVSATRNVPGRCLRMWCTTKAVVMLWTVALVMTGIVTGTTASLGSASLRNSLH